MWVDFYSLISISPGFYSAIFISSGLMKAAIGVSLELFPMTGTTVQRCSVQETGRRNCSTVMKDSYRK